MIVLMDLEWVENQSRQISPTQLAALRVNEAWETVSRFDSLCRPRDASFCQWDHVAFAGAPPESFILAPLAKSVLSRFQQWLQPDDVLLWWGGDAPRHFAGLTKILGLPKPKNKNHSVQAAFQAFVNDGRKTKGRLYQLAKARDILTPKPEHSAANDVKTMRLLLQKVSFSLE